MSTKTFGSYTAETKQKGQASPMAIFTRGESAPIPGQRWRFTFANGYGASVINDGYGADEGLYELAVIGLDGRLCYDTPVTDDVLGWLSESEVAEALDRVAALSVPEVAR